MGIEEALFICPKCGKIGTLSARAAVFCAAAGLTLTYDDMVILMRFTFKTVAEWVRWQNQKLKRC
jgi:hypothetical protein